MTLFQYNHPEFERAVCNTSSRCFSAAANCLFLSSIANAARALSWTIATRQKYQNKGNKVLLFYSRTKTENMRNKTYRRQILVALKSIKDGLSFLFQLLPMLSHFNQNTVADLWCIACMVEHRLHQILFSIQEIKILKITMQ